MQDAWDKGSGIGGIALRWVGSGCEKVGEGGLWARARLFTIRKTK